MGMVTTSGILIIDKDNRILICHPTNHPKNVWSIPKGKVNDGESIMDAAIRETFEETNINLSFFQCITPLEPQTYTHKKKRLHPFLYLEKMNPKIKIHEFEIKCNSNVEPEKGGFPEMDDFKWVSFDEAKKLLHNTQVKALEESMIFINKNNG